MTSATERVIEPFYFGPPERQLLGLYHGAVGTPRGALLFCAPHGHEFIQFHRVCRLLATLLSEAGFDVLRFDFGGCGDSAGDESAWGVERWVEDAQVAAKELAKRSRTDRTGALGLRLGATIAARLGLALGQDGKGGLDSLVLWDAVHDGPGYLRELEKLQGDMLRYAHVKPERGSAPEVLGFAMPKAFSTELAGINLAQLPASPAARVLVIESHDGVPQQPMCDALGQAGIHFEHQRFSNPHLWAWTEDFAKVHVPRRILDAIVAWSLEGLA